jgi:hypothetical protein
MAGDRWFFKPLNDECVDCGRPIDIKRERHYITFDPKSEHEVDGKKVKGAYRRRCAECHDAAFQRPYERRSADDGMVVGDPTRPPPPD